MATRGVKSNVQMCCVAIDFSEYLLPLAKGLALIDLMQHATKCDSRYGESGLNKTVWTEVTPARIELEVVSAGQIKAKPPGQDSDEF